MRKWKARLTEARVDKKLHGSKREREVSAEIDTALRFWDPKVCRRRKFLPLDVIVLGYEPATTLLVRRLKEAAEEKTELVETKERSSSFQGCGKSQKSVSELKEQPSKDHEGDGRPPMLERCVLATCARELLAIRGSSGAAPSSYDTEVDLIAASYLLKVVSQSTDGGFRCGCASATGSGSPSSFQQQARLPAIRSTLITAPQNLTYSLHNLSTNHDPRAKYLAPYLSAVRHALITIDLACVANIDTLTNQAKILTTLELFKSIVQGWSGCRPSRLDIFLVLTNVEQLNHQLSSAEHKLDSESLVDFGSKVHKDSQSLLDNAACTAIYRYVNSLFADVEPWEVAALPSPPPAPSSNIATDTINIPRPSPVCRATLHYILSRFHRVPDSHVVSFYPCFIDTKDNTSLRRFWSLVNDVVISESLQICYCFGTTPSPEDRGPPAGRFNF